MREGGKKKGFIDSIARLAALPWAGDQRRSVGAGGFGCSGGFFAVRAWRRSASASANLKRIGGGQFGQGSESQRRRTPQGNPSGTASEPAAPLFVVVFVFCSRSHSHTLSLFEPLLPLLALYPSSLFFFRFSSCSFLRCALSLLSSRVFSFFSLPPVRRFLSALPERDVDAAPSERELFCRTTQLQCTAVRRAPSRQFEKG